MNGEGVRVARPGGNQRGMRLLLPLPLALALSLLAPAVSDQDATVGPAEDRTDLTIPFDLDGGFVVLPISINGSEPLPIILDTGMPARGIVLFDGPHVERLDLDYLPGSALIGGAGGGKSHRARVSAGATFELGSARIEDSQLIVMPPIPYFDIGYAGIIGIELLSRYTVHVDQGERHVVLTPPADFVAPEGATAVPLEIVGGKPFVEARMPDSGAENDTIRFVLDLGARHALSLDVSHPAIRLPERSIERQVGRGLSGPIRGRVGRLQAFELGGYRLESVIASFQEGEDEALSGGSDGNLGIGLMNRFDLTLDYATKTLYLAPGERFEEAFEADMTGLVLESEDGEEVRVAEVIEGSPVAEAGIAAGDRVLTIDGAPVTGRDLSRLDGRFRTSGPFELTVATEDAEPRRIELMLRRLL